MAYPELDAFIAEAGRIEPTMRTITAAAWQRPGLGEWTIAELVSHLIRQADRIDAYLDRPLSAEDAVADRRTYFEGSESIAAQIAERARAAAKGSDPATFPQRFADAWRRSAQRATSAGPERLIETLKGPMRLDEFTATRVVELVVHHMDLRHALDLPADADPGAARLTMDLLERMLGRPRPRNLGRTRFILAATGRIASEHPDLPVFR